MGGDEVGAGGGERGGRTAAVAVALLALFGGAEAITAAALYDYRFGFAVIGGVAAGAGGGYAVGSWLRRRVATVGTPLALALAALAVVATLLGHLLLPAAPSLAAFLQLVLPILPAAGVGAALAVAPEGRERTGRWSCTAAMVTGPAVAAAVTRYAGGPLVATALAAAGLALAGLVVAPAGVARRLAQGALVVLVLVVLATGYRLAPTPRWGAGHGAKPLYRDLTSGDAHRFATRWQGVSRLDLARERWSGDHLLWPAIDGSYLVPVAMGEGEGEREWRRRNFPLLTLAFEATRPARMLVVSPGGGLAVRMARDAGVRRIDTVEPSRLARRAIGAGGGHAGDIFRQPGVSLSSSSVLTHLAGQDEPYDAILLTLPVEEGGWRVRDPAMGAPFTREALTACWHHLTSDGYLIVVAGDGGLYGRTLLAAWAAWANVAGQQIPLTDHAAGVRRLSLSARAPLLQYLALLRRDGEAGDLGARLETALAAVRRRGLPPETTLAALFGPEIRAKAPYPALAKANPEAARPALFQALSWRVQTALDLRPATVDRPLFFQMARELPGPLKTLLLLALAFVAALLMLPLGAARRVDHPAAAALPPLPLLLAVGGLAVALPAAAVGASCLAAALATGGLALPLASAAVGGGVGVVVGGRGMVGGGWTVWGGAALLLDLAAAGGGRLAGPTLAAASPAATAGTVVVVAAVAAFLARQQLAAGRAVVAETLPELAGWIPAVAGAALLVAAVAMPWTVQGRGIVIVWLVAAGGHAVVAGTGMWIRRLAALRGTAPIG